MEWKSGIGIATGIERGAGAPRWGVPCERVEARRTRRVMKRNAAVAAAGLGDRGARGGRECEACARGGGPWQSARSSVGLR
jgi:hypothetical protein